MTPWTAARQASLSFTISQSLLKTQIHRVGDAIQPSHPLSSPPAPAFQSFPASGCFPMSQFFTSGGQNIGASAPIYKIVNSLKTGCFPSPIVCIFKDWELKHEWQGTVMFQTEMLSHLCAIAFKQQSTNGWYCRHWVRVCVCVCVCVCVWEMLAGLWACISSLHVRWKGLQHSQWMESLSHRYKGNILHLLYSSNSKSC